MRVDGTDQPRQVLQVFQFPGGPAVLGETVRTLLKSIITVFAGLLLNSCGRLVLEELQDAQNEYTTVYNELHQPVTTTIPNSYENQERP